MVGGGRRVQVAHGWSGRSSQGLRRIPRAPCGEGLGGLGFSLSRSDKGRSEGTRGLAPAPRSLTIPTPMMCHQWSERLIWGSLAGPPDAVLLPARPLQGWGKVSPAGGPGTDPGGDLGLPLGPL